LALDGGGWSTPRPSHCTPGKDTLYGRLGGPQCWSEQVWKILHPPGFDPWTVQPIASHYIDYTIQVHHDDTPQHYPGPLWRHTTTLSWLTTTHNTIPAHYDDTPQHYHGSRRTRTLSWPTTMTRHTTPAHYSDTPQHYPGPLWHTTTLSWPTMTHHNTFPTHYDDTPQHYPSPLQWHTTTLSWTPMMTHHNTIPVHSDTQH
jgi:hypothetical protein